MTFVLLFSLLAAQPGHAVKLSDVPCVSWLAKTLGIWNDATGTVNYKRVARSAKARGSTLVESLGVARKRALAIAYGPSQLNAGCETQRGGRGNFSLADIDPGSLDLLILTDSRDLHYQRSVAELTMALKKTMKVLAPGGRLLLVGMARGAEAQFEKHLRAADALGLRHESIDLSAKGASGFVFHNRDDSPGIEESTVNLE